MRLAPLQVPHANIAHSCTTFTPHKGNVVLSLPFHKVCISFHCNGKIHTNCFPRVFGNTKGYKEEEPDHIVLVQLQTIQLEQRALESNNINMLPPETFPQSFQ
jgi:hypothetical protein